MGTPDAEQTPERCACHEAGHAVAVDALGFRLVRVWVEGAGDGDGTTRGGCLWERPRGLPRGDALRARLCVGRAGHVAERLHLGAGRSGGVDADRAEGLRLCRRYGLTDEEADALVVELAARAAAILGPRGAAVAALASALVASTVVDGADAHAIIDGALRARG